MRGAAMLYLVFVGLLFCAAGGVFTWLMWRSFERASGQRSWREVDCQILESRVEERKIGNDVETEYSLAVLYGYEFEGAPYTSQRYSLRGSAWSKAPERAGSLVAEFPEGETRKCYVNPEEPGSAVLKRDSKAPGYSLWFPILMMVGGIGIIAGAVRSYLGRGRGEGPEATTA